MQYTCGYVMFSILRKWLQYGSYGATLLCFFSFREYSKYYCGSITAVSCDQFCLGAKYEKYQNARQKYGEWALRRGGVGLILISPL